MPTPSPAPVTPTPNVPIGDFGSASKEIGNFGVDDGTGNGVYSAFMSLYNSLFDIMSDNTVPDSYFSDVKVPDKNTASSISESLSASYFQNDEVLKIAPYSSAIEYASQDISRSMLLDKWKTFEGETSTIGSSFDVSPYSVEIVESSVILGQDYREGNSYLLNYRVHIPARFIYSGHTGSAFSNPLFLFHLSVTYADAGSGSCIFQYGEPTVYIDGESISYDKYSTLKPTSVSGGIRDMIEGDVGFGIFNVPVLDAYSQYSYDLVIEFPLYISDIDNPTVFHNSFQYESRVTLNTLTYQGDVEFIHISDEVSEKILQDIVDEQKKQNALENERYEQEQDTIHQATDSMTSGVDSVTDTLTSWEIVTMPVTIMSDFLTAITSSGNTTLTFPSFQLMGQTLWPSYDFDLKTISDKFPLLCNSLHLISGIFIALWFLRYLWRKWALITGDDLPDEEVS